MQHGGRAGAAQAAVWSGRGWRNPELPDSSQRSFSWKIYSSELIVWLGTMVRMLPCKLNNSCPLFNLFDLDYNNLLCALDLFLF